MTRGAEMSRKNEDLSPICSAEMAARRMVEEAGADAVVILWTSQTKRTTKFFRHQIGNGILCNALIERMAEEQDSAGEDDEEDDD